MNREYAIALQYVRVEYRALYAYAEAVVLTPARLFPTAQLGQCSADNYISINDRPGTVSDYVDTLVHELTHAMQNRRGMAQTKQQREEEAYQAGIEAATEYMRKAAPWARKG